MMTLYLLVLAGWLFHSLTQIKQAHTSHSSDFNIKTYLGGHIYDMLVSLIAAVSLVNIIPSEEITNIFAFCIGYSSQSIIRDLMKKTTWKKDEVVSEK
jgi:hypothetical protein